jgi:hypothetical protein
MQAIRKFLVKPRISAGQLAEVALTTLGMVGLLIGLAVMPSLGLSLAQFYASLMGLVGFMVLCFCAGQLAIIRESLSSRNHIRHPVEQPPDAISRSFRASN